ncbi:helix-turn-helix transcriptional regulator [Pontibacter sp. FD36]|uniref:helix-turn-helix transcriptional regulator n=1 Tax=Pontibacter sp. FD36 TaxID=2789860 RepID=UPI0018ABB9F8|nr:AraC family transcriptional regulator [Pontibacter sp. FD36]MBF8963166.1 helix-turn-helix transcriptional regulator [Pontibacter sp. FD36]
MEQDLSISGPEHAAYYHALFSGADDTLIEKEQAFSNRSCCEGNGQLREFYFEDIYFGYTQCELKGIKVLTYQNCQDFVQMHFSLRCRCAVTSLNDNRIFARFDHQQHNLLYFGDRPVQKKIAPEEELEVIIINLSKVFLLRYLKDSSPAALQLRECLTALSPGKLCQTNLSITPRVRTLLYELINCPYAGHYKRMFLEAKVVELLMLQLEQCDQVGTTPAQLKMKDADVEKMYHARDILLQNLENPHSLVELAHLVGTNEYYLKKHFKQVFGTTVFGYLNDYRMEQAKQLILQGDLKIGDIATMLGYKYAAHFTSAFKKHFGYLPQQLKS